MPRRFWMLGEAVESCQACRPWATRPTLPSAKIARSQRDEAALGVLRRCADEESTPWLSLVGAPCTTPNPGMPGHTSPYLRTRVLRHRPRSRRTHERSPRELRQFPSRHCTSSSAPPAPTVRHLSAVVDREKSFRDGGGSFRDCDIRLA